MPKGVHAFGEDGRKNPKPRKKTPPPSSQRWSRESLAWLAGLMEGEGCLSHVKGSRRWTHRLLMSDADVVLRAHELSGVGCCHSWYPPRFQAQGFKPQQAWVVNNICSIYALMVAVYPWLGERRRAKVREMVQMFLDS